jgi:hypothetical protein
MLGGIVWALISNRVLSLVDGVAADQVLYTFLEV